MQVTDPYRWLERWDDGDVQAWTDAQNTNTRAQLDALPFMAALRARVRAVGADASPRWGNLKYRHSQLFAIKRQPPREQPMIVVMRSPDDLASERIVVDPAALDPSGSTAIDFYEPSADGSRVAVSLSVGGNERGDVHIFDVATGRQLSDVVPRVNGGTAGGSLAWNADGSGFFYTRYPRPGERPEADLDFFQQLYFHKIGGTTDTDAYEIGRDFPKIAEAIVTASDDGRFLLATVNNGDGGEKAHYVRPPSGGWIRLAGYTDEVITGVWGPDDALYLLSRQGAPRGRILRIARSNSPIACRRQGRRPTERRRHRCRHGDGDEDLLERTHRRAIAGARVRFERHAAAEAGARTDLERGRNRRARWRRRAVRGRELRHAGRVLPGQRRRRASQDGAGGVVTRELQRRRGVACRGDVEGRDPRPSQHPPAQGPHRSTVRTRRCSTATVVTRSAKSPGFSATRHIWFEQGGTFVVANIRGGGEFGEEWHRAGNLTKKQNVFDDFAAAARYLIDQKYTSPASLAIMGGSNGGLLMGATLTQHPELFRAVVSYVGIYDMLRFELYPNGAFNVTEFGNVADPEQFRALYAYSPLHHVVDGTKYPAVMMFSGTNDPRVNPADSRKFTARLQAANVSDHPILLRISSSGHGFGTTLSEGLAQGADEYAFLFWQLGMGFSVR